MYNRYCDIWTPACHIQLLSCPCVLKIVPHKRNLFKLDYTVRYRVSLLESLEFVESNVEAF